VCVQSLAYNSFSDGIQKINHKSLQPILDTISASVFPGSQLYLYFRMYTAWEEALDPSEFITDTAFIYKYQLPREERTEALIVKHFNTPEHINNIYRILMESWAS